MKRAIPITTLFLDVGGVLLTNGWDHHARRRAAKKFHLEWAEMRDRHTSTLPLTKKAGSRSANI